MVEELETDPQAGFRSCTDAAAAVEEGGVTVFVDACRVTEDVKERLHRLLSMFPENFASFFRS